MIKLGDKVKDKITNFTGIAVVLNDYLQGCRRIGVQSTTLSKEGKPKDWVYFDEPQLVIVKKNAIKENAKITGGIRPDAPQR